MYSDKILKFLTLMYFKGEKHNKLPDLEVIGLDQKCFDDPKLKLEIRNLYGRGGAYTCDYFHRSDENNEVALVEKSSFPKNLLHENNKNKQMELIKPLVAEMRLKVVENINLTYTMFFKKDINIDEETNYKFILVADNKHVDFTRHEELLKLIENEMNNQFGAATGTVCRVVFADYMIVNYKTLLLNKGF